MDSPLYAGNERAIRKSTAQSEPIPKKVKSVESAGKLILSAVFRLVILFERKKISPDRLSREGKPLYCIEKQCYVIVINNTVFARKNEFLTTLRSLFVVPLQ